jgi:hypothetical protein
MLPKAVEQVCKVLKNKVDAISGDTISEDTISEDTISEDTISKVNEK